jgi:hypothetical protein
MHIGLGWLYPYPLMARLAGTVAAIEAENNVA